MTGGLSDVLDKAHAGYPNPVGIFPRHGWFGGFVALVIVLAVAARPEAPPEAIKNPSEAT